MKQRSVFLAVMSLVVLAFVTIGPAVAVAGAISMPFKGKDVNHGTLPTRLRPAGRS